MRKTSSKVAGDINPWFRSKVTFTRTEFTKMDLLKLAKKLFVVDKNKLLLSRTEFYRNGLTFTDCLILVKDKDKVLSEKPEENFETS